MRPKQKTLLQMKDRTVAMVEMSIISNSVQLYPIRWRHQRVQFNHQQKQYNAIPDWQEQNRNK